MAAPNYNYDEIIFYKDLPCCKENPFIHPISIIYQDTKDIKFGDKMKKAHKRFLFDSPESRTILNQVIGILNKLCVSNFDKLSSELLQIDIPNDELLEEIVKSIFNKAVYEPHFGEIYSKLCLCFGNFNVKFKQFMLTICQKEFEKSPSDETRKTMVGNILFIGQLFKKQMISEQIVHYCIRKLLEEPTDFNIECVCKLLEIAGNKIKQNIDENFEKLTLFSENKNLLSSRHRFMIKDILDLKKNNWVSRKTNQPLKII
jgi:translation initiation factor 4G